MDDASGGTPDPGVTPEATSNLPASAPRRPDLPSVGGPPTGGTDAGGLQMEACYRHPTQLTGVHCTRCGKPICVECMRPAAIGYQCPECLAAEQGSGYQPHRGIRAGLAVTPMTQALLVVTCAVFVIELVAGATQLLGFGGDNLKLIRLGAAFPPLTAGVGRVLANGSIVPGSFTPELWRFVTPMFLHLGLIHLAFNMYALAILGPPIERAYGRWTFLALYLVTGIMGNVASFVFGSPVVVGAGASTAVFGLFGVWLAYNFRRRDNPFHQANLRSVLVILLLNFVLNLSLSSVVDWRAHVGGFVTGAVLGYTTEGIGRGAMKHASVALGFVAVLGIGAVLVVTRIHQLQSLFGVV
jgi:membrane associated rhomboid family serine protease